MIDPDASCIAVQAFAGFRRPVRSRARSTDFYCGGLGFRPDGDALRLGSECIELLECTGGPDQPMASPGCIDTGFQHIAVVTCDMAAALQRLSAGDFISLTQGGPVTLPVASGGVTAFKFLDPDGHPLELLQFPAGSGAARWHQLAQHGSGPTLGIDHSAIVVADVERSIAFYRARLGFTVGTRQVNQGAAQDRLDGLHAVCVDVVALEPRGGPGPHLELLGYRVPPPGPSVVGRSDGGDCLVWSVQALPDGRSEWLVRDPDGHRHLLRAG